MHVATTAVQHDGWIVGRRYLHGKTSRPLTLRYIGPLPPISSDASTSNPGNSVIWLGVEYDDPSHGKGHSGTYEGTQVFNTRQQGAGAFVKLSPGALKRGPTLVEAIEERYGDILPRADHIDSDETTKDAGSSRLYLGTSSREVETPGLAQVQIKVGKLERLREIGLDGRWVDSLGGSKETQKALRNRVHRVTSLDLSNNLLSSWMDLAEITACFQGLRTLILNHSRMSPLPPDIQAGIMEHLQSSCSGVTHLHLGDAGLTWDDVMSLDRVFTELVSLYVNANPLISALPVDSQNQPFSRLENLILAGCPVDDWTEVMRLTDVIPSLHTLDLSSTAFSFVPPPSDDFLHTFPKSILKSLVIFNTRLKHWSDMDNLELWTRGKLESLRISSIEGSIAKPPENDLHMMSGNDELDRPWIIAKLSGLKALNSTPITSAERQEAERVYVNAVSDGQRLGGQPDNHGRFAELSQKYGNSVVTASQARRPRETLRSKMLTLRVRHGDNELEMSAHPSAQISVLRRKIARQWSLHPESITLWILREETIDDVTTYHKVMQVEEPSVVDAYLSNGDVLLVESCQPYLIEIHPIPKPGAKLPRFQRLF